jgi:hypothetical protein
MKSVSRKAIGCHALANPVRIGNKASLSVGVGRGGQPLHLIDAVGAGGDHRQTVEAQSSDGGRGPP